MKNRERDLDERLADWVDGCMSERDRERFVAELRVNPQLRQDLERYERTVAQVRAALQAPTRPVQLADRVLGAIRATADEAPAPVVPLPRSPRSLLWSLVGAAALLGIALWVNSWAGQPRGEARLTAQHQAGEPRQADDRRQADELHRAGDPRQADDQRKADDPGKAMEPAAVVPPSTEVAPAAPAVNELEERAQSSGGAVTGFAETGSAETGSGEKELDAKDVGAGRDGAGGRREADRGERGAFGDQPQPAGERKAEAQAKAKARGLADREGPDDQVPIGATAPVAPTAPTGGAEASAPQGGGGGGAGAISGPSTAGPVGPTTPGASPPFRPSGPGAPAPRMRASDKPAAAPVPAPAPSDGGAGSASTDKAAAAPEGAERKAEGEGPAEAEQLPARRDVVTGSDDFYLGSTRRLLPPTETLPVLELGSVEQPVAFLADGAAKSVPAPSPKDGKAAPKPTAADDSSDLVTALLGAGILTALPTAASDPPPHFAFGVPASGATRSASLTVVPMVEVDGRLAVVPATPKAAGDEKNDAKDAAKNEADKVREAEQVAAQPANSRYQVRQWLIEGRRDEVQALLQRLAASARGRGAALRHGEVQVLATPPVPAAVAQSGAFAGLAPGAATAPEQPEVAAGNVPSPSATPPEPRQRLVVRIYLPAH